MRFVLLPGTLVATFLAMACASPLEELKDRASFDLSCPKAQIQTQRLANDNVQGVSGCGRKATYVYDERQTVWVMNTDTAPTNGGGK